MKYHVTDPSMEFLGGEGVKYCFLSINQKAAEKKKKFNSGAMRR